jgi:hypothetical protein
VLLGRFPFSAGEADFVELRDVAGDQMRAIWFDTVKWVRAPVRLGRGSWEWGMGSWGLGVGDVP